MSCKCDFDLGPMRAANVIYCYITIIIGCTATSVSSYLSYRFYHMVWLVWILCLVAGVFGIVITFLQRKELANIHCWLIIAATIGCLLAALMYCVDDFKHFKDSNKSFYIFFVMKLLAGLIQAFLVAGGIWVQYLWSSQLCHCRCAK